MNTRTDGESRLHALIGAAFTAEPALPDVDDALARITALGQGIRTRQRIRTGIAAALLCVSGFGMIAGIAAIAHSNGGTMIAPAGGNSDDEQDPVPSGVSRVP